MPCTPLTFPDGSRAIVCTRGPRPRCACGTRAALQCDAPAKRKSGTCDRHLCASCATEVGPDRHLCQEHAASGFAPANEASQPVHGGLF